MEAMPTCKPWKRPTGQKDPSRSILLDLKPFPNWQLPATVLDLGNDIAKDLTEDLQVQCLPSIFCKVEHPEVDIQDVTQSEELSRLWKNTHMG